VIRSLVGFPTGVNQWRSQGGFPGFPPGGVFWIQNPYLFDFLADFGEKTPKNFETAFLAKFLATPLTPLSRKKC